MLPVVAHVLFNMLKEVQEIDPDLVEKTSNLFYPPLDTDAIYKSKDQFLNRIRA